ncbi:hypothetical protein QTP88_016431 [Uroleucon formosanum]
MMREYDDQLLSEYFDVSFMDVVTALLDASERRYSTDYEPEVKDDGEEVFDGGINDFVVSMVSVVVIASEMILEMQPSGTSKPQRGQAAPQEIENVDGVKTKDEKVDDTGMQPVKAETSAKSGGTADLDCKIIPEDNFYCSNGLCVEWSWICDGRNDCSDGTDEIKDLCAPYEYGINMTSVDCGRVYSNHHQYIENGELTLVGTAPWSVGIYRLNKTNLNYHLSCGGSIIAPNVVISAAQCFWQDGMLSNIILVKDRQIVVVVVIDDNATQLLDVEKIYLKEGYYGGTGFHVEDIAVIVLARKVSFANGVAPVCIDWNSIYDVKNGDQGMVTIWDKKNITQIPILSNRWFQYIDPGTCRNINLGGFNAYVTFDKFCTDNILGNTNLESVCTDKRETNIDAQHFGGGISFLHFNSYYLTGILSVDSNGIPGTNNSLLGFTDINYHIKWIRDVLNKHFTGNSCVLPTAEGVVYSYEGSNETLSHGTLINRKRTVIENCKVGYHKAYTYSFRYCLGRGRWLFNFEKLCFS